jgi:hypothetical protein
VYRTLSKLACLNPSGLDCSSSCFLHASRRRLLLCPYSNVYIVWVSYACFINEPTSQSMALYSYDVVCGLNELVSLIPRHLQLSPDHFEILRSDAHGPVCVFWHFLSWLPRLRCPTIKCTPLHGIWEPSRPLSRHCTLIYKRLGLPTVYDPGPSTELSNHLYPPSLYLVIRQVLALRWNSLQDFTLYTIPFSFATVLRYSTCYWTTRSPTPRLRSGIKPEV